MSLLLPLTVHSGSRVQLFATLWAAACLASLFFTFSHSLLRFMPTEPVMLSNHLILYRHFSFCLQSFPSSGSFPISQLFTSGGQIIGASASVLPINIQCQFPLGLTSLISLQSKEFSVFSSTII